MRGVTPLLRCCMAAIPVFVASSILACAPGDRSDPAPPPGAVEVPADEPMDAILNEDITEYRPDGVTYDGKSESRADGYITTNFLLWSFVGSSDDAVATAAQQLRDAAVADGWTLTEDFVASTGDGTGLYSAMLSKGSMRMVIDYLTGAYVSNKEGSERSVTASIEFDPGWAHQDQG